MHPGFINSSVRLSMAAAPSRKNPPPTRANKFGRPAPYRAAYAWGEMLSLSGNLFDIRRRRRRAFDLARRLGQAGHPDRRVLKNPPSGAGLEGTLRKRAAKLGLPILRDSGLKEFWRAVPCFSAT